MKTAEKGISEVSLLLELAVRDERKLQANPCTVTSSKKKEHGSMRALCEEELG